MALNTAMIGVLAVVLLLWVFLRKKNRYWEERGIPFVKPDLLLGNLKGVASELLAGERFHECYKQLKNEPSPIGGIFFFTSPVALVLKLDFLRNVFVKDFNHFRNHGMYVNERDDPLSAHLFSIEDDQWKSLRTKLSPTFTSGKMKMMFPTIQSVAEQFGDHLKTVIEKKPELEFRELLNQFTTDIIGNTAFGIECNTMKDPEGELRNITKLIFRPSKALAGKLLFLSQFPEIGRKLRVTLTDSRVTKFFMGMIKDIVKHREENDVKRNDFMSLLLQIKNTGKLEGEEKELGKMTFNELAAQVFIFFFAGYETSSSTMTFSLYELARNPEIQNRARREIEEVLERHKGEMSYEAAMEMTYVDQIIQETLRKYPIVDTLFRKVSVPYKVPNTKAVLEKDSTLIISVLGIHRDPEIYPEPEKFDPDRFTKENVAARHPYSWIPFGEGPRNCIGMRFGMMQMRLGLVALLRNFTIHTSEKTPKNISFIKDATILAPQGGMHLQLKRL